MYPAANIGALLSNIVGGDANIAPPGAGHAASHAGAARKAVTPQPSKSAPRGRQAVEVDQQAVTQARLGQQVVLAVEIGELRRDLHEQVRHHAHDVRVAAVVKDALRRKKQHARRREGSDLHPAALRAEGHGLAEARAACSGRAR